MAHKSSDALSPVFFQMKNILVPSINQFKKQKHVSTILCKHSAIVCNYSVILLNNKLFVVRHSTILLNNESFVVNTKPFYVKFQSFDAKTQSFYLNTQLFKATCCMPYSVVAFLYLLPLGLPLGQLMTPFLSCCYALSHVAAL
jgi:hypothetical protein